MVQPPRGNRPRPPARGLAFWITYMLDQLVVQPRAEIGVRRLPIATSVMFGYERAAAEYGLRSSSSSKEETSRAGFCHPPHRVYFHPVRRPPRRVAAAERKKEVNDRRRRNEQPRGGMIPVTASSHPSTRMRIAPCGNLRRYPRIRFTRCKCPRRGAGRNRDSVIVVAIMMSMRPSVTAH